jgi:hypothetical protein
VLRDESQLTGAELVRQALEVDRFKEARSKDPMHLDCCSGDFARDRIERRVSEHPRRVSKHDAERQNQIPDANRLATVQLLHPI